MEELALDTQSGPVRISVEHLWPALQSGQEIPA